MRNRFESMSLNLLAVLVLLVSASPLAAQPIKVNDTGLSKGSVFDVPEPKVAHYPAIAPGESKVLPRAYAGAPPQVSHDVSEFLPLTAQSNMCVACHNQPAQWGKKLAKGDPTPMPPSHYTDQRNAPGKVTAEVVGARYNCNVCHVPQSDASALVENTFGSARKR